MTVAALQTRDLCKQFGALKVTNAVSLVLKAGGRHALIGPNGAGKSTLINLLTGVLAPSSGSILLEGEPIDRLSTDQRVARGLGRTFQINALFPHLTPLESIMLAVARRRGRLGRPLQALHRQPDTTDEAYELARSVGLDRDCLRRTAELSYGRQRLVEIALALAGRPRVLLLDEPAAGVPAGESFELMQAIESLPDQIAVLFIEHDMDLVFRFADTITVLVAGSVFRQGKPGEIATDPEVRRIYLGDDRD
ncbi:MULTISPECIES: ABC transporter ATP-binding protein [Bradyrhizobium]|uniref:ABC transporter ATP-binding protein n=3 Tax=Bradyrhizobium TaxID=374 RepID=A0AAE5X902_9BRAD|nr:MULTISPECIES: ABC transporter ATP-binding protein [Bradyrhizobium]MCG2628212.1 ABC transporter ATP-binding protein [Bradyrhizobium zhengyangense]MCG2643331.1 ABC transporter ATP-binding protein [Bradyrhizobium zhengyangense]MCG2670355.1 ABC transporter ATP-binding protein [Bradyrhizobium zhengyangense]MDN4985910.1 ABC transporter ATP-binding protein [Bradyrhizobium sp. WYCCWR 13022]MDN5002711.1 ABC transporter ATP-binding protein [Bradyrhizobium sp. WYCCWR 12677]